MTNQAILNRLVLLTGILALLCASVGLFWLDSGSPFTFTTLHGQSVEMYGKGLYRYDTLQAGATLRGTDAITLLVALPLLVAAFRLTRRSKPGLISLRGQILLASLMGYFLYNSASLLFSAAYNNLHLAYILYFAASLFGFILAFTAVDLQMLSKSILPRMPHKGIAIFLLAAGLILLALWASDIVMALVQGQVPTTLASYTTVFTYGLDLGVIVPAAILSYALLVRRHPMGYLLAPIMLVLNALIGLVVIAQTVVMMIDGVMLSPAQLAAFVGSFVVLASIAAWFAAAFFRNIGEPVATAAPIRKRAAARK